MSLFFYTFVGTSVIILTIKGISSDQGDINCGPSSHPDFIKNYFLSNFLKLPLKFSVASHPGWQNGTINVTQCVAALNIFTHQS